MHFSRFDVIISTGIPRVEGVEREKERPKIEI